MNRLFELLHFNGWIAFTDWCHSYLDFGLELMLHFEASFPLFWSMPRFHSHQTNRCPHLSEPQRHFRFL